MNVIKVKVKTMVASEFNSNSHHDANEPKYATDYVGELDFNGAPFHFKFHADTYFALHGRSNFNGTPSLPNHKFQVIGLDLDTLERVGTNLDFNEAIAIFNDDIAKYKIVSQEFQKKQQRKHLQNCTVNRCRIILENVDFTVPTVDDIINSGSSNSESICARKVLVNPYDPTDTDTIVLSSSAGLWDIYLNCKMSSRGRIKSVEKAIEKVAEFERIWLSNKKSEKDSKDYKTNVIDHIKEIFGLEEVGVSDESYMNHQRRYVVTGQKYEIASSKEGCYNGNISVTASKDSKGVFTYKIKPTVEFNREETLEIVALMKKSIDRQDKEDQLERAANELARKAEQA